MKRSRVSFSKWSPIDVEVPTSNEKHDSFYPAENTFHFLIFRYYQVRSSVKATPKVPVKIEVSLPRNEGK